MPKVIEQVVTNRFALYNADCVEAVSALPDNSIDLSVFSPPFASLYTYSASPRDMGNSIDGDEFAKHFRFLVADLLRVTKPGRLIAVHCMQLPTSKTRDGMIGIRDFRGELIRSFVEAGGIYHSEVCIWKDPVTAMQRTKSLGLLHKTIRTDSSMSRQGLPDYVVVIRKVGKNPDPIAHTGSDALAKVETWQRYASPVWVTTALAKTKMSGTSARFSSRLFDVLCVSGARPEMLFFRRSQASAARGTLHCKRGADSSALS